MEGEEGRRGRERARDGGWREGRRDGEREGGKEGRRMGTRAKPGNQLVVKPTLAYASAGCDLYTTT